MNLRESMLYSRHPAYYKNKSGQIIKDGSLYDILYDRNPIQKWANSKVGILKGKTPYSHTITDFTFEVTSSLVLSVVIPTLEPYTDYNIAVVDSEHNRLIEVFTHILPEQLSSLTLTPELYSEYIDKASKLPLIKLLVESEPHSPRYDTPIISSIDQIEGSRLHVIKLQSIDGKLYDIEVNGVVLRDQKINKTYEGLLITLTDDKSYSIKVKLKQ